MSGQPRRFHSLGEIQDTGTVALSACLHEAVKKAVDYVDSGVNCRYFSVGIWRYLQPVTFAVESDHGPIDRNTIRPIPTVGRWKSVIYTVVKCVFHWASAKSINYIDIISKL